MVYVLLGNGFEEIEALTQVDYLRRADIEIKTVGLNGKKITGGHEITVEADIEIENIDTASEVEMVILPGGLRGVAEIKKSEKAKELIHAAWKNKRYIAAICAAPSVLAEMGLLKGKNAICFPGMEHLLIEGGASVVNQAVVIDNNIITAKAAGSSEKFSFTLIDLLKGKETARRISESICAIL